MARRRKYRRPRTLASWATIKGSTKHYKTMRGVINFVFKDESNYNELLERLHSQSPEMFENKDFRMGALYGKEDDKKAILDFVETHAKGIYRDMKMKNSWTTFEEALSSSLNTRTYTTSDEIAITNFKKFLRKRDEDTILFKDELRRRLDVNKLDFSKLRYSKNITIYKQDPTGEIMTDGYGNPIVQNQVKGYVFEGSDVAITLEGTGKPQSPYHFELHINKSTSI